MKIVYIALKGMPLGGGIEKYVEEVGSRLSEKGHEIIAYTTKNYRKCDYEYKGMKIKTLPSINTKSLQKLSLTLLATLDQFREKNVDIVHFQAIGPSIFSFAPRLVGRKTLVQLHGLEWQRSKWGLIGKSFLWLNQFTAAYFPNVISAVSKVQKNYFESKFKKKVHFIPPGINPPTPKPLNHAIKYNVKPNEYMFFAARLVREKGAHYLIEAFNKIHSKLQLVIAGDAEHEEKYKIELSELAKGNPNIIFTGFIQGELLEEFFSNAYIFVQPSEIEGLPISLLEAMSYGNCCVASDIPENIEAMEDYGYLFKTKNSDSLAEVITRLERNSDLVKSKKNLAKYHVTKNYNWDSIAKQFEDLYQSILQ